VLANFQCFSEYVDGSEAPTMQTVEVVADARERSSSIGALKGDFYLGKLADTGALGVVEEYRRREFDGQRDLDASLAPVKWSPLFLSESLRICRVEGDEGVPDSICVYGKQDATTAQGEIATLLAAPVTVEVDDEAEEAEVIDTRPIWQQRLDKDRFDDVGAGSDIP